jgi:S-adenosylmethionine-dependent methyltransferase
MPQSTDDFDSYLEQWKANCDSPRRRLIYEISRYNIKRYMQGCTLRVLDVGGGNGYDSLYYAGQGHTVTLVDISPVMLADATERAREQDIAGQLTVHNAHSDDLVSLFPEDRFDLILCHLMLEFVACPEALLRDMCSLLAPDGLLSVIDPNRYSESYRMIFYSDEIPNAINAIGTRQYHHPWVNRPVPLFSAQEIANEMLANGCEIAGQYGISNVYHYLPDSRKSDPESLARIEELEIHLTDQYPYNLLARMYQVIGRKP